MQQDENLIDSDRKILSGWLDREKPPSNGELKSWKQLITNSQTRLIESETYPLTTFSQKVASHYNGEATFNKHLATIEINLGIQPNRT